MELSKIVKLTRENYFSPEANKKYMSVSRYKNYLTCEHMAKAKDDGLYKSTITDSLLVGSYVDAWGNNELPEFREKYKDTIISSQGATKGQLKAPFKKADKCIETLKNDPLCMEYLSGEKQVIFTASLFDVDWKICVDSLNLEKGRFTDLKCVADFEWVWDAKQRQRVSFVESWGYNLQMAIYQKIIHLSTGNLLTPYIVAVTKQDPPDKAILNFTNGELNEKLDEVENHLERIMMIIDGDIQPRKCGTCEYCRLTKVLTLEDIKHHAEL